MKTAGFPELYPFVFIHSSIKTRIETYKYLQFLLSHSWFLYIVPLKQGLKQNSLSLRM